MQSSVITWFVVRSRGSALEAYKVRCSPTSAQAAITDKQCDRLIGGVLESAATDEAHVDLSEVRPGVAPHITGPSIIKPRSVHFIADKALKAQT